FVARAPTLELRARGDGAGVPVSYGNALYSAGRGQTDEGERVAHLTGIIATVGRIADTELTVSVESPAFELTSVEDPPVVEGPCRNRFSSASRAEIDDR